MMHRMHPFVFLLSLLTLKLAPKLRGFLGKKVQEVTEPEECCDTFFVAKPDDDPTFFAAGVEAAAEAE